MTGKFGWLFRSAGRIYLILLIAVPLIITTFTYNQSALPKNAALIFLSTLFLFTALSAILLVIFTPGKTNSELDLLTLPRVDIPLVIFLAAAVVSSIFSINPYVSVYGEYQRQIGLIVLITLFLHYVFNSFLVSDKKYLLHITRALVFASLPVSVYAVLQQMNIDPFGLQPPGDTRPVSTIGNAVFTGGYLAMIFPITLLNLSEIRSKLLRYALPLIILTGITVTRTRSAYLAVTAEMIVIAALYFFPKQKNKGYKNFFEAKGLYFTLIFGCLLAVFMILFQENIFVQRFLSIFSSSGNQRWLIWRDALGIFWKYPLTGTGIGNFASAFAEFYSTGLRYDDVNRYIDNAHNNYLQVLFTMGIAGLASHLLLLGSAAGECFRNLFRKKEASFQNEVYSKNIIYIGLAASLAGYMVYGITNFDEITILMNLFVLLLLVKGYSASLRKIKIRYGGLSRLLIPFLALCVILFAGSCSLKSLSDLKADIHFLNGEKLFAANKFKEGVNETNIAVTGSPENPVYRYKLALNVYNMVLLNKTMLQNTKIDLLKQAANEVIKAKINSPNVNECDALLCLIYYLSGKTDDARELEKKVLEQNKVNIFFRLKLAYQFIDSGNQSAAREQLDVIKNFGYNSVHYWLTEALYFYNAGNRSQVSFYCMKVLEKEPQNPDALELNRRVR